MSTSAGPRIALVASIADADIAATLRAALWAQGIDGIRVDQAFATPATIGEADEAIVVMSSRTAPGDIDAHVDRAFGRIRMLPVLVDLDDPPRHLAHFFAGVRTLHATHTQMSEAGATLASAITRRWRRGDGNHDGVRLPVHPASIRTQAPSDPIPLSTWSFTVRGLAPFAIAFAAMRAADALRGAQGMSVADSAASAAAFDRWLASLPFLAELQTLVTLAIAIAFVGWLRAAIRLLVLAHRQPQAHSGPTLWLGYLAGLLFPPLPIAAVTRTWHALTRSADVRPSAWRWVTVTVWWLSLEVLIVCVTFGAVRMREVAHPLFFGRDPLVGLEALRGERLAVMWLFAIGYIAMVLTVLAAAVIAGRRGPSRSPASTRAVSPGGRRLAAFVVLSAADRGVARLLGARLRRAGIDLFTTADGHRPPLSLDAFDTLVVFGRAASRLNEADLTWLHGTIAAGTLPVIPVCWGSQDPPEALRDVVGPRRWHRASPERDAVTSLAIAIERQARRPAAGSTATAASAADPVVTLDLDAGATLAAPRVGYAALVVAVAWALVVLCQSLANIDLHGGLLLALRGESAVADRPTVATLVDRDLAASGRALAAVVVTLGAFAWTLWRRRHVFATDRGPGFVHALFDRPDVVWWSAGLLLVLLVSTLAAARLHAPLVVTLLVHSALGLGLAITLFALVRAAGRRLRDLSRVWDMDGESPGRLVETPMKAPWRYWLAPIAPSFAMGLAALVVVGLLMNFGTHMTPVNQNPADRAAVANAEREARQTVDGHLLLAQPFFAGAWLWWLFRRRRERRRVAVILATMAPLVGHATLPDVVREAPGDPGIANVVRRLAHGAACTAALTIALSQVWLLLAAIAPDLQTFARHIMLATLAVLLASAASVVVFWGSALSDTFVSRARRSA